MNQLHVLLPPGVSLHRICILFKSAFCLNMYLIRMCVPSECASRDCTLYVVYIIHYIIHSFCALIADISQKRAHCTLRIRRATNERAREMTTAIVYSPLTAIPEPISVKWPPFFMAFGPRMCSSGVEAHINITNERWSHPLYE